MPNESHIVLENQQKTAPLSDAVLKGSSLSYSTLQIFHFWNIIFHLVFGLLIKNYLINGI